MMKKIVLVLVVVFVVAEVAGAANLPSGVTGLWRFQDSANKLKATVGADLENSNPDNAAWMTGPWTMIGVPGNAGLYADGGIIQDRAWDYLSVNPNFTANGGGDYVNQYTILMDVYTGSASWFSLYQTAWGGNDNDGDLWVADDGTVGVGDAGYSTMTLDQTKWHRIVLSVDNGDAGGVGGFFRVYVDGTLFLDGAGQGRDGRFSLYTDRFNLFADDSWEDSWILSGTVATWNSALTTDQIAPMGGWIGASATPTELMIPEPATMSLLAIGGLALLRRNRK